MKNINNQKDVKFFDNIFSLLIIYNDDSIQMKRELTTSVFPKFVLKMITLKLECKIGM